MQQSSVFGKLLFFWAALTVLAIITYNFLPPKTWEWIPTDDLYYYPYADDMFGGASYAERVSPTGVHMRCKLQPTETELEPFCGFHIYMDYTKSPPAMDLSNYTKMYVDLDYIGGNRKLRFYIRDFEKGYSDPNNPIETAKYMSVYVPATDAQEPLVIDMQEFTVADWWVNNNDVPREHSLPSLNNVVAFGVDVAYPAALGPHELKLNKVTFTGQWISAENWYLGILVCWISGLFITGTVKLYEYRRLVLAEKAERARLEKYTSDLQKEKAQYRELSMVDHLTGLLNRHGLSTYWADRTTKDHSRRPTGVLLVDIDYFKAVNDTYGHNAGDEVLRRVADTIVQHSRQSDKAARWGGEEFLILMPDAPSTEAYVLAERLRESVQNLTHPELSSLCVSVSIGVGEIKPGDDFDKTLEQVDKALYQAKRGGRNRVVSAPISRFI